MTDDREKERSVIKKKKKKRGDGSENRETSRDDRSAAISECEFDVHTDLCQIKLRSLTRDSREQQLEQILVLIPATGEASLSLAVPFDCRRNLRAESLTLVAHDVGSIG